MALPVDLHDVICPDIPELDASLGIRFPGGVLLEPVGFELRLQPRALLGQLNTALMPLVPIFNIIDALIAVGKVFGAVKTLNPYSIGVELVKLLKKLDKLLALIPQVSVPVMIVDTIDALIAFLRSFRVELEAIITQQIGIDASAARGAELGGIASLDVALGCAQANLDFAFETLKVEAAPVNRLVGIINIVAGLAGLPEVPALDDLGPDATGALAPIDALIEALTNVRATIPV